jgi:glucuronosyltransferase
MKIIFKLLAALVIASQGHCANILYIHGIFSPSHHIWNSAFARGLASRGHNVTFLSTDPQKKATKNLHYILIEDGYELFNEVMGDGKEDYDLVKYVQEVSKNMLVAATYVVDFGVKSCKALMAAPKGIDRILSYPSDFKFDLVVHDMTLGPCLLPVIQKFGFPPVVGVSAFLNPPYTDFVIGGHKHPAYVPHYLLNFPPIMTFYQRSYNLLINIIEKL